MLRCCRAGVLLMMTVPVAGSQRDEQLVLDALSLAHTRASGALARFHGAYQLAPADPRVTQLEVITEYRRAVLLAQAEADRGNFVLSPTGLTKLMEPFRGQTAIRAQVSISPMAVFVGPPDYRIVLGVGARHLSALDEKRNPVYSVNSDPAGPAPMIAVTIETMFAAEALRDERCCELSILDQLGAPLLRQPLKFAGMK
jgi:hypothetical protein